MHRQIGRFITPTLIQFLMLLEIFQTRSRQVSIGLQMLKSTLLTIALAIVTCFNFMIDSSNFPCELLKDRLKFIHKSGDCDINNFRGLTVLPSLSKEFEELLLRQLYAYLESYLSERTQSTKYNGATSRPRIISLGLPQGSKLAADLFLFFINEINQQMEHSKISLFADDTLMY